MARSNREASFEQRLIVCSRSSGAASSGSELQPHLYCLSARFPHPIGQAYLDLQTSGNFPSNTVPYSLGYVMVVDHCYRASISWLELKCLFPNLLGLRAFLYPLLFSSNASLLKAPLLWLHFIIANSINI